MSTGVCHGLLLVATAAGAAAHAELTADWIRRGRPLRVIAVAAATKPLLLLLLRLPPLALLLLLLEEQLSQVLAVAHLLGVGGTALLQHGCGLAAWRAVSLHLLPSGGEEGLALLHGEVAALHGVIRRRHWSHIHPHGITVTPLG